MNIKEILRFIPDGWDMNTLNEKGVVNIDISSWNAMGQKNFTILMKTNEGKFICDSLSVRWDKDHRKPVMDKIKQMAENKK